MGSVCDYWYGVFMGLGVHMGKRAKRSRMAVLAQKKNGTEAGTVCLLRVKRATQVTG